MPDVVTTATVVVKPLPGDGALEISVSWPGEALADPVLTGSLSRIPHGDSQEIPFDAGVNPATRTLDQLAAGCYWSVVTAEAWCYYYGGPPGHEVGGDGESYYSVELAVADLS